MENNFYDQIADKSISYVGKYTYELDADGSDGKIDCSHHVWLTFKELGMEFPYQTSVQWSESPQDNFETIEVSLQPQKGDVILFPGRPYHVSMVSSVQGIDEFEFVGAEGFSNGVVVQKYGRTEPFYGSQRKALKYYKRQNI